MNSQELTTRWTKKAESFLLGRQIVRVEYMGQDE